MREEASEFADSDRRPGRRSLFYLKAVFSISVLGYIIATANLAEVWHALRNVDLRLIALAAVLSPLGGCLIAWRWRGLLRSQGVSAPLVYLIQSSIAANFFRQFLPSTIGGDAVRAYDSWKLGASKTGSVTTVAVDRIFGVVVLLFFALGALVLLPQLVPGIPLLGLWVFAGAVGLFGLLLLIFLPTAGYFQPLMQVIRRFPSPVAGAFRHFGGALASFQGRPALMARCLGISFLLQINVIVFHFLIGAALGLAVPFVAYFLIVPVAVLVMMIPVSINGIGLREGIFVVMLGVMGISRSEAVAFAWLEYGLVLFYGVLGGIVYLLRRW